MTTQTEGQRLADVGVRRSYNAASQDWKDVMLYFVYCVAHSMDRFTADDVFDKLNAMSNPPTTPENRAFGGIMRSAARLGWCKKADCAPVPSRRKELHASPITVWESRIR